MQTTRLAPCQCDVPAVMGIPVQQHGMDNQARCADAVQCGSNVRITVTALDNGKARQCTSTVFMYMHGVLSLHCDT